MTRGKAIEIMQINRDGVANMSWSEDRTKTLAAFDMAIKALEQEPCEGAISRQAAIEKIHWLGLDNDTAIKCDLAIRALSPVNTQEPKTGRWKQISPARIYECDICGQNVMTDNIRAYRYCHGCGAKMIEPHESEDKCKKCEYHRNPDYTRCHECKAESEE